MKIEITRFEDSDHPHVVREEFSDHTANPLGIRHLQAEGGERPTQPSPLPRISHEHRVLSSHSL